MILGISASGKKDGITSKTVKAILESSNSEYEYISLSGKRINGCIGCTPPSFEEQEDTILQTKNMGKLLKSLGV